MKDGPLDMRMNSGGSSSTGTLTAANLCNEMDEAELTRILKVYGDEPRSKAVAAAIVFADKLRAERREQLGYAV